MKTSIEIKHFIKELCELYSKDFEFYFWDDTSEGDFFDIEFPDGTCTTDLIIDKASEVFGLDKEIICNCDMDKAKIWYEEFEFFRCLNIYNSVALSGDAEKDAEKLLVAAIFGGPIQPIHQFDWVSVKKRLYSFLDKYDLYPKDKKVNQLRITTMKFCTFSELPTMIESMYNMFKCIEKLFFKALNEDLSSKEINKFNMIVHALDIRDTVVPSRMLSYSNFLRAKTVYKEEAYDNFLNYARVGHTYNLNPWMYKEFIEDKKIAQKYFDMVVCNKRAMRRFAMETLNFICRFVWHENNPVKYDDDFWDKFDKELIDNLLNGTNTGDILSDFDFLDDSDEILIEKTVEELDSDKEYADKLIALTSSISEGGLNPTASQYLDSSYIFNRVTSRVGLLKEPGIVSLFNEILNSCKTIEQE